MQKYSIRAAPVAWCSYQVL